MAHPNYRTFHVTSHTAKDSQVTTKMSFSTLFNKASCGPFLRAMLPTIAEALEQWWPAARQKKLYNSNSIIKMSFKTIYYTFESVHEGNLSGI